MQLKLVQQEQLVSSEIVQQDVINILRVGTYNQASTEKSKSIFNLSSWFPFLSHCFRLPKVPYPQVAPAVLKDDGLQSALMKSVEKAIEEHRMATDEEIDEDELYETILKEHEKRSKFILTDMRSKISDLLLRFASLLIFKLLPLFMSGVVAHPAHVEMLKKAAKSSPDVPLIFLPLHRSHLDYILVSFILFNNELRAPIVAAGDNLRIPFFG